ncbi:MFS transporter [Streptomyces sp. NPDC001635]
MGAMTAARSMVVNDALLVMVALPTIQRSLNSSVTDLQWFVTSFLLSYACLVALGGRAGDTLGHVGVFKIGVGLFVVTSAAAGLAQSPGWLIAARVGEGVGAALLRPTAQVITVAQFPREEQGRVLGISSSVGTVFYGVAPLVGGLLTALVSWRAIFFINVPVGLACLGFTRGLLPHERLRRSPLDLGSVLLIVCGMGAVVLAVTKSRDWGGDLPTLIGLLAGGVLLLVAMIMRELRRAEPLMNMRLFSLRSFTTDASVLTAARFSVVGYSVFTVVWLRDVLGFSVIQAGVWTFPLTFPGIFCGPVSGVLSDRLGPRKPAVFGGVLMAGGMLCAASTLHFQDYAWILVSNIVVGVGTGFVTVPIFADAFKVAPLNMRGQVAGVIQTSREMGGVLGIAIMGAVITHEQGSLLMGILRRDGRIPLARFPEVERSIGKAVASQGEATLPAGIPADLLPALKEAVTEAVSVAFYLGCFVAFFAVAVAATSLSPRPPDEPANIGATKPS